MTATNASGSERSNKAIVIAAALLVAAVLIAVIIALSVGDSSDDDSATVTVGSQIPQDAAIHVAPAEINGTPLPRFEPGSVDPAPGMAAPAISATYYDGGEATIAPDDGHPRIIMFLAHW